jgi:hypothetical protein
MSQGLAVTLLRRACLAWAETLREVRVDVGKEWRLEISKSIYIALAGCPHLETVSVPDIFLHYYDCHDAFRTDEAGAEAARPDTSPHRAAPLYFRTLRHLDLHDGPHTEASWRVICGKLSALHTLVLRFQRHVAERERGTLPLMWYPVYGLYKSAVRLGAGHDLLARIMSLPVYGSAPLTRLMPPSWGEGFATLLQRVGIKRLYVNGAGLPDNAWRALNDVAYSAVRVRRRRRRGSSSSSSDLEVRDHESDYSDDDARNATSNAAAAATGWTVGVRPRFTRRRPRHCVETKDLIPLEVFSVYGWRTDELMDIKPFMRYLARSAPHLREVGLVNVNTRAVLALRHAISTSLTGLDLRYIDDMGDLALMTLLRSRAGRRLRSLRLAHDSMFEEEWTYAALSRHPGTEVTMPDGSCSNSDSDTGNTTQHSPATETAGPWRLGPEPRLRRLRRVHVRTVYTKHKKLAHAVFNGPRVVFAPYAVVPPL